MNKSELLQELIKLSRTLGDRKHDWAILGEGNTSTAIDAETFLVKASGSQLGSLTEEQVATVRFAPILDALSSERAISDAETKDLLLSSCVGANVKMPSVETLMHAYLLTLPGVNFVGHTHVTTINGLTCSEAGWKAISSEGRMFPDEIVVCGVAPCVVPYVDPGVILAKTVKSAVESYIGRFGENPKTIYMQNHGFIALGKTSKQVVDITMMADKAARIMLGAFATGGPTFLTEANVARIHTRPDEHYRQAAIAQQKPVY
jgi:rhamnose utilization protein RhaD (predicted bifunctional aldolase and dehydrogenase)